MFPMQVAGDTIYNMLRLAEVDCDREERPSNPHKIKATEVHLLQTIINSLSTFISICSSNKISLFLSSRSYILRLMTLYRGSLRKLKRRKIKRKERNPNQKPQSECSHLIWFSSPTPLPHAAARAACFSSLPCPDP